MENIKKSEKKLKDFYICNMLNILVSLKNNINLKEKLTESIINYDNEKEIIYYTKILSSSNNKSLIIDNANNLITNFNQIFNSYETTLNNIKNELLNIQKILISNKEYEIKKIFTCNNLNENDENKKDNKNIYLNLIELDKKYNKILRIKWDSIDFKDYFKNPEKLKQNITKIYSELKEVL